MSELKKIAAKAFDDAIETDDRVVLPELAQQIIDENPGEVESEMRELVYTSVLKYLKEIANRSADDNGQMELFGFPKVIAIPCDDEGYYYQKAGALKYQQLLSGCKIREENVSRAMSKLNTYREALARVESIMVADDITLAQAVKKLTQ
jgi:hypothetical protein